MDAVVNAANSQLTSGGVAGALHNKAGPELSKAGQKYAPLSAGDVVMTPAFNLPNSYVIHCLSPIYGKDHPEDQLLSSCYRQALRLANENQLEGVTFPAISTGAFSFPFKDAMELALSVVFNLLPTLENVKRVRFVLFSEEEKNKYVQSLQTKLY